MKPRKAKVIIHVNQHVIRHNKKMGESEPPITVRRGRDIERHNAVTIFGQDGLPAATIIYSPDRPLPCGARVWLEVLGAVDAGSITNMGDIQH